MPRMIPNDNQSRVIIRGKTPVIGSPSKRVEHAPPSPERGMARDGTGGDRVAVAPSRREAAAPSAAGSPAVRGRGFPDRIEALEVFVEQASKVLAELQAFRDSATLALEKDLAALESHADVLSKDGTALGDLQAFKDDATTALKEYAGRVGQLEAFKEILTPALEKHGISLQEPDRSSGTTPAPAAATTPPAPERSTEPTPNA